MPLALAVLLSFLLAPIITLLQSWRFGRIPAVLTRLPQFSDEDPLFATV
jgi:predicted PurR-regulated permease PerM